MPVAGPFYFAWVEPSETSFNSSHYRMDEYIFSAKRTLAEGEKPLLEIEIQNPHVGILSSGRKYWAWFSWFNGSSIVPIFFGRVVGSPTSIFEEVISLQLVADPIDYKQRVQRVAETLKYHPFYDQVFIDVAQRDDPNTILEAHAKVWDVDPVTHEVTANDIILGDSNEDFTEDDHFYDSMNMTIGQPPATAILMDASVPWIQTAWGTIDITNGYRNYKSLNGDGIISEWPKPLTDLGGGYRVLSADAFDTAGVADAQIVSVSWNWTNKEKEHSDGDCLSVSGSSGVPMGGRGNVTSSQLTFKQVIGLQDPFAVDEWGDPSPINIPASVNITTGYVFEWNVAASLIVQYEAHRSRTERVIFLVRADTQPIISNPTLDQTSEVMTKNGADVGVPIINLLNWSSIAGQVVTLDQIIFPDNPSIPGGKSIQIAVTAGTAGTVEPDFSDIPGFTTNDGSVVWSSMGASTPTDNAVDWTYGSHVNAGTIILPKRPFVVQLSTLKLPGLHVFPQTGITISAGTYIQNTDGSYAVCTISGTIGLGGGGSAVLVPLAKIPSGTAYFIATQAGVTGPQYLIPPFNETLHATTHDGTVVWTCVGIGEIPIGGIPGQIWSATYFATDRGRQSLEYLASLVRAKLLYRSRCIGIDFNSTYARGVNITTRKTVTLYDPRIAGGVALGKVKGAVLSVSDSGVADCSITLACCAGLGNAVTSHPGSPSYVADGYVDDGYQKHDNVTSMLPTTTDLGYAPPSYVVTDDGLTFPLTREQIMVVDVFHDGNPVAGQALSSMAAAAQLSQQPLSPTSGDAYDAQYQRNREVEMASANSLAKLIGDNPSWQEFQLKPVVNGPFHAVYNVKFTNLQIPMGIDLQSDTIT